MIAKISSMTGYGRPPNQRLILPACLAFWFLFLLFYWSSSIIPFKPAESFDLETQAIDASTEAQATSVLEPIQHQAGQNDTPPVEDQESTSIEPGDQEPPPEVTYPRDLAANATLGVSSCFHYTVRRASGSYSVR